MRTLATKQPVQDSTNHSQERTRSTLTPVEMRSNTISPLSTGMPLLQRQCACGGGCPRCQDNLTLQTKLKIGEPGDVYEQEADQVADEVMPTIQRQMEPEEDVEEMVQMKAISNSITPLQRSSTDPNQSVEVPKIVNEVLRSPGQPLDPATRALMEPRFGHDFSHVRVHTGGDADRSARDVNAHAYTVGDKMVFSEGKFAPTTLEGQRLIAHELTHVIQQRSVSEAVHKKNHSGSTSPSSELSIGVAPSYLSRTPADTAVRSVPAPIQAPTIASAGNTSVVAACQQATDVPACRQHKNYVLNILPQVIANIRSVSSPYSAAIADLYTSVLPAAQTAAAPIPWGSPTKPFGASVDAVAGPVTVTFGSTKFTFTKFSVSLQQQMGGANGQAFSAGGPIAFITLNEASDNALLKNLAGVEATMIHEVMHIFMEIIEGLNVSRTTGNPIVDPNLDRTSYATLKTSLESVLLPFVTNIQKLPSFTSSSSPNISEKQNAVVTADTFLSEIIARTEAGIFEKQRSGQTFVAADLRALPPFFHGDDYWSPTPPVKQELTNFILTNQSQIDSAIQPIIYQIGERYLNLRP